MSDPAFIVSNSQVYGFFVWKYFELWHDIKLCRTNVFWRFNKKVTIYYFNMFCCRENMYMIIEMNIFKILNVGFFLIELAARFLQFFVVLFSCGKSQPVM